MTETLSEYHDEQYKPIIDAAWEKREKNELLANKMRLWDWENKRIVAAELDK